MSYNEDIANSIQNHNSYPILPDLFPALFLSIALIYIFFSLNLVSCPSSLLDHNFLKGKYFCVYYYILSTQHKA